MGGKKQHQYTNGAKDKKGALENIVGKLEAVTAAVEGLSALFDSDDYWPLWSIERCEFCEHYVLMDKAAGDFFENKCPRCMSIDLICAANIARRLLMDGRAEECIYTLLAMETSRDTTAHARHEVEWDDKERMVKYLRRGELVANSDLTGGRWENSKTTRELQFKTYFAGLGKLSDKAFKDIVGEEGEASFTGPVDFQIPDLDKPSD